MYGAGDVRMELVPHAVLRNPTDAGVNPAHHGHGDRHTAVGNRACPVMIRLVPQSCTAHPHEKE